MTVSGLTVVVRSSGWQVNIMDVFMDGWIGRGGPVEKGGYVLEGMIGREWRVAIVDIYQALELFKGGKPPVIISVNFRID